MKITIGALAHVDAGKTTLAETILYKANVIRNLGRVDNSNTFLDYNDIEKQKGITVYNKQANFSFKNKDYIYLDTPGHNDLAYETNRALPVIDCAILLISAIEDIPADTIKKFNDLLNYNIPILIFVNKMDISPFTKDEILNNLKKKLSQDIIDYTQTDEYLSLSNDTLLEEYLSTNKIDKKIIINNLSINSFFPCFFGSALKDQGIDELLNYIYEYVETDYDDSADLNAYIYHINNDYSYLKILSGTIHNKDSFSNYKINEMYEINGNNYSPISTSKAGDIVAVKGIKEIPIGTYIPSFNSNELYKVPSLTYALISNLQANELYKKIEPIINEFPELQIQLEKNNVYIKINGELHATIVKKLFLQRLGIEIEFSNPIIKYKETVSQTCFGVGHFEPLRHYAEVIVKLKPIDKGIVIKSLIENTYTNTLITYLRTHILKGILTNSPLCNIEISIVDIKTHPKHTEGGDLINATKRAIRQALSKTDSILLEPLYLTSIDVTQNNLNDVISLLTLYKCTYTLKEQTLISKIPIIRFNEIITSLKSKLKGNINFSIEDTIYEECENKDEIINTIGYDYKSDMKNPAGSIFCKNGAGHYVEPEDVENNMHLLLNDYLPKQIIPSSNHNKIRISDDELNKIINSLYKPRPRYVYKENNKQLTSSSTNIISKPIIYLIDGYNLMYYLDEENALNDLISAREKTINLVCDYAGYVNAQIILVFDAYKTDAHFVEVAKQNNITVVYTKNKQTADQFIEIKSKELCDLYKIIVVTSDNLEQMKAFANNASIISSREFLSRYSNLQKNSSKHNDNIKFKQLEDIKKILED